MNNTHRKRHRTLRPEAYATLAALQLLGGKGTSGEVSRMRGAEPQTARKGLQVLHERGVVDMAMEDPEGASGPPQKRLVFTLNAEGRKALAEWHAWGNTFTPAAGAQDDQDEPDTRGQMGRVADGTNESAVREAIRTQPTSVFDLGRIALHC